ncbi:alpha/beta fold hydrolase [Henriciella barbarensis]|uniref:Alpha/beta fold hydrolase n=1 Tax=Henriciella barbarensis TaxID=86342 RepID=A0A399R6U1_9PROT|nr:alpha/beta hydrolase [Henriciella barbarensis]RIJ26221.1 alpha/beta fold hydrolase [Henriciella barbarensis]
MDQLTRDAEALLDELKPRSPSAAPGQNLLPPQTRFDVQGETLSTPAWRAGDGAPTLFVHGWDDTHRIWRRFAMDFIQNGRPALLIDLPAHGASSAETCSWQFAGQSVLDVCTDQQPIDAIITHSFGSLAAAAAISEGAQADYLVMIAPPIEHWSERQRRKGVPDDVIARAAELLLERKAEDTAPPDLAALLARFEGQILLIGSQADESCPAPQIEALGASLGNAETLIVDDLSHRDLALDPAILSQISAFLGY